MAVPLIPDGIEWDWAEHPDRLVIAGVGFGICMMLPPVRYEHDQDTWDGVGPDGGWDVLVPTENGALVGVGYDPGSYGMGLTVFLLLPWWSTTQRDMPCFATIQGSHIVADPAQPYTFGIWTGCEPEWMAEHISRLARLPVRAERPATAEPIRLTHARVTDDVTVPREG